MYVGPDFSSDDEDFADDPNYEDFQKTLRAMNLAKALQNKPSEADLLKTRLNNMYSSIIFGRTQTILEELNVGFDINANLQNGWTPLLLASSYGNHIIVKELVDRGVDVNQSREGSSALLCACNSKIEEPEYNKSTLEVIKHLLSNGANARSVDNKRKTSLMMAASNGHMDAVKLLLPYNDKHAEDNQKWTALFWAVDGNSPDVVRFLIDEGLEIDKVDVRGKSLLELAQTNGCEEIISLLLPLDSSELVYLFMNSNFEEFCKVFENLKDNEKPRLFGDICKILYGVRGESVAALVKNEKVSLFELLSTCDENLKELGIILPYQRKRILCGMYRFHQRPFHWKSLPVVPKTDIFSNVDVALNILTCVKQVITIEASLKFILNNMTYPLNPDEKRDITPNITKLRKQLATLKKLSQKFVTKAKIWDSALTPADLITKKRRNVPWCDVIMAVSLGTIFITYKLAKLSFR